LNGSTFPLWAHIARGLAQVAMIGIAAYLAEWLPRTNSKQD
jgi:hypothetical protein